MAERTDNHGFAKGGEGTGGDTTPIAEPAKRQRSTRMGHTRTAGTWGAVVVAIIVLIVLLIFILQNLQSVTVTFLGLRPELPLGVALLLAAAFGGLLVALVGAARILQLRRGARSMFGARKRRGRTEGA